MWGLLTVCFCLGTLSPETSSSFLSCYRESPCQENECFLQAKTVVLWKTDVWGFCLFVCCLGICLVAFSVHEELFSGEHCGALLQPCPAAVPHPSTYRPWMCTSFQASPAACRHPACSSHPEIVPPTHRHTSSACLPCVRAYVQQFLLGIRSQVEGPCFPRPRNEMGRHHVPLQALALLLWSGEVLQSYPGILCIPAVRCAC